MARTAQDTIVLGVKRVYVSRASECFGFRCGVGQCTDGSTAVMGRDTSGAALYLIDSDSKWRSQQRGVVLYLMGKIQLFGTADGQWSAEHATGLLQHKVDHLWCNLLSGTDKVAFILAVFIIYHDDEFAGLEVNECLFDSVEFQWFHILVVFCIYLLYSSLMRAMSFVFVRWMCCRSLYRRKRKRIMRT